MALEENNTNPIDAYETSGTSPTTGSASATDSPEQLDAFKQSGTSPTEPFDDNGVTNCTDSYSDFEAEDENYDLDSHDAKSEGLIEEVLPRPSQPEPKWSRVFNSYHRCSKHRVSSMRPFLACFLRKPRLTTTRIV